jgi:hypothetical protein
MSMQLGQDFVFDPEIQTPDSTEAKVTKATAPDTTAKHLGPLAGLVGTWTGAGFNTIWRPFHAPGQDRFLELNPTKETLSFEVVEGAIPNRGLLQKDIKMHGVHYLQKISDTTTNEALHFEPGIWLNIPRTTDPSVPPTVARLGSIPHGTTVLMQGTAQTNPGPPSFDPVSITPFVINQPNSQIPFPESDLSIPTRFRTKNLKGITQGMVDNPNSVLASAIAGQTITETTTLIITTLSTPVAGGGTANTAFLEGLPGGAPNADAAVATAIFWIETVKGKKGKPDFLQLQYTQTVLLDFNGLSWPHVSVATLRLVSPNP